MTVAAATHVAMVEEAFAERQEYHDFLAKQRDSNEAADLKRRRKKNPAEQMPAQTADTWGSGTADSSWGSGWYQPPPQPVAPAMSTSDLAAAVAQGVQAALQP